jgi:acetyltransferase-like isoleucine patch superfamily enzyme
MAGGMKRATKWIVHGTSAVLVSPLILLAVIERALSKGEVVFAFFAEWLAFMPGLPGVYLRAAYYWATTRNTSWEIHVGFGSLLVHREVTVRAHASMGAYCVIGHADIGEKAMMGSRVSIPSGKRQHLDESGNLSDAAGQFETVKIGAGSWVGEGAIIMADVGAHSIVSSGAVVIHATPDRVLVGGNPARVIRELTTSASK